MPEPKNRPPLTGVAAEQEMRRLTRRSFVTGAVAAPGRAWRLALADDGDRGRRRALAAAPHAPFQRGAGRELGSPHRLAPTFPRASVQGPARTNGLVGLSGESMPPAGNCASSTRAAVPSKPISLAGRPGAAAHRPGDRAQMRRGLE